MFSKSCRDGPHGRPGRKEVVPEGQVQGTFQRQAGRTGCEKEKGRQVEKTPRNLPGSTASLPTSPRWGIQNRAHPTGSLVAWTLQLKLDAVCVVPHGPDGQPGLSVKVRLLWKAEQYQAQLCMCSEPGFKGTAQLSGSTHRGTGPGPHTVMKTQVSESVRNALGGRVEKEIKTGRQQN